MIDVYSWIMSEEAREYLRKKRPLSFTEKMDVIIHAYRPIEEQLEALQGLLEEACGECRQDIEDMILLYQLVIREVRDLKPGEVYLVKEEAPGGASYLVSSYADLEKKLCLKRSELLGPSGSFYVEKWGPSAEPLNHGRLEQRLGFSVSALSDTHLFSVTNFWIGWLDYKSEGISEGTVEWYQSCDYADLYRRPFPFPFASGELLRVDVPFNTRPSYAPSGEPVVGVLERRQTPYAPRGVYDSTLHYISREENCFKRLDLTDRFIGGLRLFDSREQYRVMDFVHRASLSDLPAGHEVLWQISQRVQQLRGAAARELFNQVFGAETFPDRPLEFFYKTPYRSIPKTLDELL